MVAVTLSRPQQPQPPQLIPSGSQVGPSTSHLATLSQVYFIDIDIYFECCLSTQNIRPDLQS
jgi:hypothetical protein